MIAQRILAVAAAVFLVASIALGTLTPPGMPLGQALFLVDHSALKVAQDGVDAFPGHWAWTYCLVPLLVRPLWILPTTLGIICAGLSMTLASRQTARNSHRRRS